jgi:3-mercaptopyruvate sulfurtransferase SseA
MVPCALSQDGLFQVDGTWGTVQPIQLAPGVRTVGELELIEQLGAGAALVDTRLPHFHRAGTIPGAVNLPHEQVLERIG